MQDKQEEQTTAVATTSPQASLARFNWTGLNPSQMKGVAQAMAMSGMFPDIQRDSAKAFVKIMAGQEMGIPPFQAMSDISIIQGKAAAGGNIYAAKVKSHPRYDYRVKNWTAKGCAIEFFEVIDGKRESIGVSQFDENDARTAGLLGKGNWKTYPRNMFFNRAMTAGVRTYCPDALNGINAYTPEELGANVDEDGSFVSMPAADKPQPVKATVIHPEPLTVENALAEPIEDKPTEGDTDIVELAAQHAEAASKTWVIPEFKPSKMALPEQRQLINKWLAALDDEVPGSSKNFVGMLIGKEHPGTNLEAMQVIQALADKLNEIADSKKQEAA